MKIFNFYIVLFLCLPFFSMAQKASKKEREQEEENLKYFNEIFGKNDKDFEINEAPEQWKSEEVVILCQKMHISFFRFKGKRFGRTKGVIRKRVLIQDKSALENFSEFYYREGLAVGIRHIKPGGNQIDVDTKTAIKVETDVPKFYADSYSSDDYYKIAISDLEVGDILDFFKVFTEDYASDIELINTISTTYPIVNQEIIFDIDRWSFFYGSFNGAPEFVEDKRGGVNYKGEKKSSVKRFKLKDSNRAATKDERWAYTYLSEPVYKIMAIPPNEKIGDKKLNEVIDEGLNVKEIVPTVLAAANKISKESTIPNLMKSSLRDLGLKKMPAKRKVEVLYNSLRYHFLQQNAWYSPPSNGLSGYDQYTYMRSDVFASMFVSILKKNSIESYPVAVTPRYFGDIDKVVTTSEIEYGVYVPTTKQYFWSVESYRSVSDPLTKVCGATGYKYDSKGSGDGFKKITVPQSKPENHSSITDLEVIVNEDYSLEVVGTQQYKGAFKNYYSPLLLLQTNYIEEDQYYLSSEREKQKIDEKKKKEAESGGKPVKKKRGNKRVRAYLEKAKQRAKELSTRKREIVENWLKDDYEIEELKDFEVTAFGRFPDDDILEAELAFSSKGYLQKAGPNLIFEVGKLITGQAELDEEEINERKNHFDRAYARTLENNIIVVLPEGYTAQGLDQLNVNVDNPYAAFISEVTQDGNTLTIKTVKTYKKEHVDLENWNSMVEMLEAAYAFSQKKLILKK